MSEETKDVEMEDAGGEVSLIVNFIVFDLAIDSVLACWSDSLGIIKRTTTRLMDERG